MVLHWTQCVKLYCKMVSFSRSVWKNLHGQRPWRPWQLWGMEQIFTENKRCNIYTGADVQMSPVTRCHQSKCKIILSSICFKDFSTTAIFHWIFCCCKEQMSRCPPWQAAIRVNVRTIPCLRYLDWLRMKSSRYFWPGKYLDWIKIKVSKQNLANQQMIFIRYFRPWEMSNSANKAKNRTSE